MAGTRRRAMSTEANGRLIETRLAAAMAGIEYGKLMVTFHQGEIVSIVTEERRRLLPQGDESVAAASAAFQIREHL
jgi:hypothetical protein